MIIDFKVGNFLSYNNKQTFSMKAGKTRNHIERVLIEDKSKILKFMAIYGANGSGKSNLIKAFKFFQNTIIKGIHTGQSNLYCRLDSENKYKNIS